jgi:tRNA-(ms[2]io[6]A)-hydroxylase
MVNLGCATTPQWAVGCLAQMDAVLCDHAHCEKKAAVAALSLLNSYPQHAHLVRQMAGLAQEELRHFRQVYRFIEARGLQLPHDAGDPYVGALRRLIRHGKEDHFIDRLLVSALIEARSCERLGLLGQALTTQGAEQVAGTSEGDADLGAFYLGLAVREAGHAKLFVRLAERYADRGAVTARLADLVAAEADIVQQLPVEPRIH